MGPNWQQSVTDYLGRLENDIKELNDKIDTRIGVLQDLVSRRNDEVNTFKLEHAREIESLKATIRIWGSILGLALGAALTAAITALMRTILK